MGKPAFGCPVHDTPRQFAAGVSVVAALAVSSKISIYGMIEYPIENVEAAVATVETMRIFMGSTSLATEFAAAVRPGYTVNFAVPVELIPVPVAALARMTRNLPDTGSFSEMVNVTTEDAPSTVKSCHTRIPFPL